MILTAIHDYMDKISCITIDFHGVYNRKYTDALGDMHNNKPCYIIDITQTPTKISAIITRA